MAAVPALVAVAGGCGGSDNGGGPDTPELTSVEVSPATARLFTVAPGTTVQLSAVPKDQNGVTMTGLASPSFSSQDEAVATVASNGTVTAVAVGTADITASFTTRGVSRTGAAPVTVEVAASDVEVTAPGTAYQPATADINAGGTVTWTFGGLGHDVAFTVAGSPGGFTEMANGSVSRVFPTSGVYPYICTIHAGSDGRSPGALTTHHPGEHDRPAARLDRVAGCSFAVHLLS